MASVENLRNSLIGKLLMISDQDILNAVDEIISASAKNAKVQLTTEQIAMIEMGIADFENGNVISQSELFEQERAWLRKG